MHSPVFADSFCVLKCMPAVQIILQHHLPPRARFLIDSWRKVERDNMHFMHFAAQTSVKKAARSTGAEFQTRAGNSFDHYWNSRSEERFF